MLSSPTPPVVLTIAGSDSGGGAGIQADLKTIAVFGCYGTCAITALTAQNTREVRAVELVSAAMIEQQIEAVFADFSVAAIKTGMLGQTETVSQLARLLRGRAGNLVVDPVLVAGSGRRLLPESATRALRRELFALATIVTPNLPEAEALLGISIGSVADMEKAARLLHADGPRVIIKGGHLPASQEAVDVYFDGQNMHHFFAPRQPGNRHGTGCTFSAALASLLARGQSPLAAVQKAKAYISAAIAAAPRLGQGDGPTEPAPGVNSPWSVM